MQSELLATLIATRLAGQQSGALDNRSLNVIVHDMTGGLAQTTKTINVFNGVVKQTRWVVLMQ